MQAGMGDGQLQEVEQPLLEQVEGPNQIEADRDHEQADREMNQIRMNRQALGKAVGPERACQLVEREHHTTPSRIACTTATVRRP